MDPAEKGGIFPAERFVARNPPSSAGPRDNSSISDSFASLLLETHGKGEGRKILNLPRLFGKYELVEEIGRGGMGIVYRARDLSLNRWVAVKTILSGDSASEAEVQRFRDEALTSARLDHPGIVPILDLGLLDNYWYFTMKLLEGGSLAENLNRFRGAPYEAARLVEFLARTVHFAHQRGVLHRDLKPANIVFDREGRPHITDFGLSKKLNSTSGITHPGLVVGTLQYMAPEQADGQRKPWTSSIDIYSLGAMLYELLAGRPPFLAKTSPELLKQIFFDEPSPPSLSDPAVPRDLESICLKCLEKDPIKRYSSALELAEDLRRFQRGDQTTARPAGSLVLIGRWARRQPAKAALIFSVSLFFLWASVAVLWHNHQLGIRAQQVNEQAVLARRYAYASRLNLAFDSWHQNLYTRARRLLESLRPRAGQEDLRDFGWYLLWNLIQPERYSLKSHRDRVDAMQFLDGGRLITASRDGELRLWDAKRGKLLSVHEGKEGLVCFPYISSGGRFAAFTRGEIPDGSWRIKVLELEGAEQAWRFQERLVQRDRGFVCAGFSSDENSLLAASEDGLLSIWNTASWSERKMTLEGMGIPSYRFVFSPRGDVAAVSDREGKLFLLEATTFKRLKAMESAFGYTSHLRFTPSGDLLAAVRKDGRIELLETRSWMTPWVLDTVSKGMPAFSPDGKTLAAGVTLEDDLPAIDLWNLKTRSLDRRLLAHSVRVPYSAFSADGEVLATASENGEVKIWSVADAELPASCQMANDYYEGLAISRDGATIIARQRKFILDFMRLEPRSRGEAIVPAGTIRWEGIARTCEALSPAGDLAALAAPDGSIRIFRLALDNGAPWALEQAGIDAGIAKKTSMNFSSDGGKLLAAGVDGRVTLWQRSEKPGGVEWRPEKILFVGADDVSDLALSPNQAILAVARHRQPAVSLWDVTAARCLQTLKSHSNWVIAFAFTSDSRLLATGGLDNNICIWDLEALRDRKRPVAPVRILHGHSRTVASLVFLPSDGVLVSGSDDKTLKLWDVGIGEERATLRGRLGDVNALAVRRDGALISAGGRLNDFGKVVLWLAAKGNE